MNAVVEPKLDNEYLRLFLESRGGDRFSVYSTGIQGVRQTRDDLTARYAWAVPNQDAIQTIADLKTPIIEVGAGSGYWASLLAEAGVGIVATDDKSWSFEVEWYPVLKAKAEKAVRKFRDRTLMMVWPPYDTPMAFEALSAYRGDVFVYVGESRGGCNGNDQFWDLIEREWRSVTSVDVPQWHGLHDYLTIYSRNR